MVEDSLILFFERVNFNKITVKNYMFAFFRDRQVLIQYWIDYMVKLRDPPNLT